MASQHIEQARGGADCIHSTSSSAFPYVDIAFDVISYGDVYLDVKGAHQRDSDTTAVYIPLCWVTRELI